MLLAKIKTPDELKDDNHHNAVGIFKHLLKNMGDAFSFRDDGMEDGNHSKKSSDGTINNPINLDDTPIQLVIVDSKDSEVYKLRMRDRMKRAMAPPMMQIWIQ